MQSIPIGATGSFSLVVLPDHLASRFKDATLPPVLATPVMIMVMENAALNAIKPYLDAGESALGTRVDVRHLAATPAGRRVTGEAKVTQLRWAAHRVFDSRDRRTGGDWRRHARTCGDKSGEIIRKDEGKIRLAMRQWSCVPCGAPMRSLPRPAPAAEGPLPKVAFALCLSAC